MGIKACIARQIARDTVPDKDFLKKFFDHKFDALVGLAGLLAELSEQKEKDSDFATNWALVTQWGPDVRYEAVDGMSAQSLIDAIADPKSGVFQWIKTHW